MRKGDVLQHCNSHGHQDIAKQQTPQMKLKFSTQTSSKALRQSEAEVKMAVPTDNCNVPLTFHD